MEMKTRRQFLKLASAACCAHLFSTEMFAASDEPNGFARRLSQDPRRPQFHLLPTRNWMNDPNGPVYFGGKYHMFFQYNPESAVWGNMTWNHAISEDMLHWKNYPVAFTMTPGGPDAAGCFSGSAIVDSHGGAPRVYVVYTGVVKEKAHETIRNEGLKESQCLAWSDDPMLERWSKLSKPIIPEPPPGLVVTGFRDPSAWKQNGIYFMTVGSGIEKAGGCVLLYRSNNLIDWEYLHPLARGAWSGASSSNPVGSGEMWECPDFFSLDGGHVLIYSTMGKVFWQSGALNPDTMIFDAKKSGVLALDAFYAPKTQLDAHGRRILWGWIPERRSQAEMLKAGWSGMMSLPRVLHLDADGTLRMQILPETESLRSQPRAWKKHANEYVQIVPKATGEVMCSGERRADLRFHVALDSGELLHLDYSTEKHAWTANGSSIHLQPEDLPTVHAFIDGSVIEIVLSERITYTKRFYYPGDIAPDVTVQVAGEGATLRAWGTLPISTDRLTTMVSD